MRDVNSRLRGFRGDLLLPSATALLLSSVLHEEVLHESHFKKRFLHENIQNL